MSANSQNDKFEQWLRKVCFQAPTPEAHDLAWMAWEAAQPQVAGLGEKLDYVGSIPNRKVTCMKCDCVNEFVLRSDIEAAQQMGGMPLCPECHAYKHLQSNDIFRCLNEICSEYRR